MKKSKDFTIVDQPDQERTGVKAGDRVTIYLPTAQKTRSILFSVSRPSEEGMPIFENGGDKCLISDFPASKSGAMSFIRLLCMVTGLQAKKAIEKDGWVSYDLMEGDQIFEY